MAEGDQNGESPNAAPESEKGGGLRGILIAAGFTLLGGIIGVLGKGYYDLKIENAKSASELEIEKTKVNADIQLEKEKFESNFQLEKEKFESNRKSERQKLDEDLIKLALQSPEIEKRKEALSFMVETGLIADSDIKMGVQIYLAQKKPVPALAASTVQTRGATQLNLQAGMRRLLTDIGAKESPDENSWFWLSDGNQTLLVAGKDKTTLQRHFDRGVASAGFSPDSSKILVVTQEPKVLVIGISSGKTESEFAPPWVPDSADFTADGKNILLQHNGEKQYYDLQGNKVSGP